MATIVMGSARSLRDSWEERRRQRRRWQRIPHHEQKRILLALNGCAQPRQLTLDEWRRAA